MSQHPTIGPIMKRCIEVLNQQLAPEERIAAEPGTILLGDGGKLDSLGLITLMVSLEEALAEAGMTVSLIDGLMEESNAAHYHSVATLTAWIAATAKA